MCFIKKWILKIKLRTEQNELAREDCGKNFFLCCQETQARINAYICLCSPEFIPLLCKKSSN